MSRPEHAVLFAYVKNDLFAEIIKTDVPDDYLLQFELTNYFPKVLQHRYRQEIRRHPLKREIIATVAINRLINFMGAAFVHELSAKSGRSKKEVVRAFYLVMQVYDFLGLIEEVKALDTKITPENQKKCLSRIRWLIKRTVIWFLRNYPVLSSARQLQKQFVVGIKELKSELLTCLPPAAQQRLEEVTENYQQLVLRKNLAQRLARLDMVASSPDIIRIAHVQGVPVTDVARLYFALGDRFDFYHFRAQASALWTATSWERLAIHGVFEDLFHAQGELTQHVLNYFDQRQEALAPEGQEAIATWAQDYQEQVAHVDQVLADSQSITTPNMAMLSVVQRELRLFVEKVA